jgi:glycosyltransferase involved in cell wall biosynthesis
LKISFFNTYLSGGAANGAISLFRNLCDLKNKNWTFTFNYKSDLNNQFRSERSFYSFKEDVFQPNPILRSIQARIYYNRIKNRFEQKPSGYEQFSLVKQYFNTPYNLFDRSPADIIHLHWIADWIDYPSFFASIPDEVPIVWTLHDMNPFTGGCHYSWECDQYQSKCLKCPQLHPDKQKKCVSKNWDLKKKALQNKNLHIVGDSSWITSESQKSALFASARSFRTIHYSIDFDVFHERNRDDVIGFLREKQFEVDHKKIHILFGAADIENKRKGFDQLQYELAQLEEVEKIVFLSFGSGNIDLSIINKKFKYYHLGKLSPDELSQLYSLADLFIVPSLYEAFGLTAIEAMACGTPVVSYNSGGLTDSVIENQTGWIANKDNPGEMGKKIEHLTKSKEVLKVVGQQAKQFVRQNFSKKVEAEKYLELYDEVTGQ